MMFYHVFKKSSVMKPKTCACLKNISTPHALSMDSLENLTVCLGMIPCIYLPDVIFNLRNSSKIFTFSSFYLFTCNLFLFRLLIIA